MPSLFISRWPTRSCSLPPAERQLKSLAEPVQKRIVRRLRALKENPGPQGVKKLTGKDDLYRIREGDSRIVHTIREKELIVLAVKIGDWKEAYL